MNIRKIREEEFLDIHGFVSDCKPLESYDEHFYKIMLRYFGNTCFVAESGNNIAGILIGFVSQADRKTYFLWQIGVSSDTRGKGVGSAILEHVEREIRQLGCQRIELTIDPENIPSRRMFEKKGYRNISKCEGHSIEIKGNVAIKDYYKPGRHFMLYEKII